MLLLLLCHMHDINSMSLVNALAETLFHLMVKFNFYISEDLHIMEHHFSVGNLLCVVGEGFYFLTPRTE